MDINSPKYNLGNELKSFKNLTQAENFAGRHEGNEAIIEDTSHKFHVYEINKADPSSMEHIASHVVKLDDIINLDQKKMGVEKAYIAFVEEGFGAGTVVVQGGEAYKRELKSDEFVTESIKSVLDGNKLSHEDTKKYNEILKRPGCDLPSLKKLDELRNNGGEILTEYRKNIEQAYNTTLIKLKEVSDSNLKEL